MCLFMDFLPYSRWGLLSLCKSLGRFEGGQPLVVSILFSHALFLLSIQENNDMNIRYFVRVPQDLEASFYLLICLFSLFPLLFQVG